MNPENAGLHFPTLRKGSIMKKRILIIEDDVTIQTQLKTLLTGNGYEALWSRIFQRPSNR